jgi:hypothetical protein
VSKASTRTLQITSPVILPFASIHVSRRVRTTRRHRSADPILLDELIRLRPQITATEALSQLGRARRSSAATLGLILLGFLVVAALSRR